MTVQLAERRPATKGRPPKDSIVALDMFSGCGGSSQGIEAAGIDVWYAANHWKYAVEIHERNHPRAEHFIADLVDEDASDYYHPEHLPRADVLWASPSCTNHSKSNAVRAYRRNLSLFDVHDEAYEQQVTASERSRATAVCVLQYARKHTPKVIVVENVVEFCQWGAQVGNSRKGDGSTFRWWLTELHNLGYRTRVMFLNSMFFGVPQSRDRVYIACWHKSLPEPDLDFRPPATCHRCDLTVEAVQAWKQPTAAWPLTEWGKYRDQYLYVCPSCRHRVDPFAMPAAYAIDWTDLGSRIGDREKPLADSTLARIARGVEKFSQWPPFLMPAKASHGVDRAVTQPMPTQTTQQEMMLVSAFIDNAQGSPRSVADCLPTQTTSETHALVAPPAFMVKNNGGAEPECRSYPVTDPLGTVVASSNHQGLVVLPMVHTARGTTGADGELRPAKLDPATGPLSTIEAGGNHHFLLSALFAKQNGGPADTAWHQATVDPFNTLLSVDTTCLLAPPADPLPSIAVDDCFYRMLQPTEIKAGMGVPRSFEMWGSARDQVKALGNAVTPPVPTWIMTRLLKVLGR
jgi:DNA (cytosine-5)-methyltransferase 1